MPTRITQLNDLSEERIVLKVEGSLTLEDARLLGKICADLNQQSGQTIKLDLAEITFLDSESAAILCQLKKHYGVQLEGLHLFVQRVVDLAESQEHVG